MFGEYKQITGFKELIWNRSQTEHLRLFFMLPCFNITMSINTYRRGFYSLLTSVSFLLIFFLFLFLFLLLLLLFSRYYYCYYFGFMLLHIRSMDGPFCEWKHLRKVIKKIYSNLLQKKKKTQRYNPKKWTLFLLCMVEKIRSDLPHFLKSKHIKKAANYCGQHFKNQSICDE